MRPWLLMLALSSLVSTVSAAPPKLDVVRPVEKEIADEAEFAGRLEASTTVVIRSRVSGFIEKVLFEEGSVVKQGDVLFQLDPREQMIELEKAKAEMLRAEAALKLAQNEYERAQQLNRTQAISKLELDRTVSTLQATEAEIKTRRVSLELAELNLSYTRIVSPLDGRIGLRTVAAGNIVRANEDELATIVTLDPLHIYFDVAERNILRLRSLPDAQRGQQKVFVHLQGAEVLTAAGLKFDNVVNNQTGAIRARVTLPNEQKTLLPGMVASVRIPLGPPRSTLLIPETCILRSRGVVQVLIVNSADVLEERVIKQGRRIGELRVVEEGLKSDDQVVASPKGFKAGDEAVGLPPSKNSKP